MRLSPEASTGSTSVSRPGTAQEVDAAPAREAKEEATALLNLPLAAGQVTASAASGHRESDLDGSLRRDEFGMEIVRLRDTDAVPQEVGQWQWELKGFKQVRLLATPAFMSRLFYLDDPFLM